jgi:hypothetical protein
MTLWPDEMCKRSFVAWIPQQCRLVEWYDYDILFVLDQHAQLNFLAATSLKQQSAGGYVIGLTQIDLEPTIYRTRGEHTKQYTNLLWEIGLHYGN